MNEWQSCHSCQRATALRGHSSILEWETSQTQDTGGIRMADGTRWNATLWCTALCFTFAITIKCRKVFVAKSSSKRKCVLGEESRWWLVGDECLLVVGLLSFSSAKEILFQLYFTWFPVPWSCCCSWIMMVCMCARTRCSSSLLVVPWKSFAVQIKLLSRS